VALGTYTPMAFWYRWRLLFASEARSVLGSRAWRPNHLQLVDDPHASVLADCMLAHGVTNGLLSVYVLQTGQWQYWL